MSFLRGFSSNAVCAGLAIGLGLANQALLARGLGKEGFGHLGLIGTTLMLGSMLLGEWLYRGNTYVAGREGRSGALVGNTLMYGLALLVLVVPAAVLLGGKVDPLAFLSPQGYGLLAVLLTAIVLQKAGQAIVLGEDRLHLYAVLPVVFVVSYLAGNALVLLVWDGGLHEVLAAWLVAAGVVLVVTLLAIGTGFRPAARLDRGLFGVTASVGRRGAASAILIFLMFRADVYLVDHFLGAASLGVYWLAMRLAEMMQRLPNIAGVVLLPKVLGGQDEGHGLSLLVARNVLVLSAAAAVGIVVVGRPAIELVFGIDYAGAHLLLLWMLPGLIGSGFGSVLNTKLAGQGYPPVTIWAPALALVVKVAVNALLIPAHGLVGAAAATSIAYLLWVGLVARHYCQAAGVGWGALLRGRTGETQPPRRGGTN